MSGASIRVLVATDAAGETTVRAPKLGVWSDHPAHGALVLAGSSAGTLTQLHRRFALLVPDGIAGRVVLDGRPHAAVPVEYGQALFRITPLTSHPAEATPDAVTASRGASGALAVCAPTDGVFYRSPAVDAKPYVAAGDRVKTGQPVGLIEVMKTFNPIAYGGAGLPDEAEIVEVCAADGQEVRAGETLVVVKTL